MRPAEIAHEVIIAAAEAIVESGRAVTGFGLRQIVGGGNPFLQQVVSSSPVWTPLTSSWRLISVSSVAAIGFRRASADRAGA